MVKSREKQCPQGACDGYDWNFGPFHLVSESFARLVWRKAARSLISNTQSPTISANMEGQSLCKASPFRFVSDALWTKSWRYWSIMDARSDDSTEPSCREETQNNKLDSQTSSTRWTFSRLIDAFHCDGRRNGYRARSGKSLLTANLTAVWDNFT